MHALDKQREAAKGRGRENANQAEKEAEKGDL